MKIKGKEENIHVISSFVRKEIQGGEARDCCSWLSTRGRRESGEQMEGMGGVGSITTLRMPLCIVLSLGTTLMFHLLKKKKKEENE